jgi:tetratricopeptide (TPR) repeat protein
MSREALKRSPTSWAAQETSAGADLSWGHVNERLGDLSAAREVFRRACETAKTLVRTHSNRRFYADVFTAMAQDLGNGNQIDVVTACAANLGNAELSLGNLPAARAAFEDAAAAQEEFIRKFDSPVTDSRVLFELYQKLGSADLKLGNSAGALNAFKKAAKWSNVRREAVVPLFAPPSNQHEEIGDACIYIGRYDVACDEYERGLEISRTSSARNDPMSAPAQHALVAAYARLGNAKLRLHSPEPEARAEYLHAIEIAATLTQRNPADRVAQRDLAVTHLQLADFNQEIGTVAMSRDEYRQALAGFLKLAHDDPKNSAAQAELAYCYGECGYLQQAAEEFPSAIRCFEKGVATLEKLRDAEAFEKQPEWFVWLDSQQNNLDACKHSQAALEAKKLDDKRPDEMPDVLSLRSRVFARHGRLADAAAAAEKLAALEPRTVGNLLRAAEGYALCLINMPGWPASDVAAGPPTVPPPAPIDLTAAKKR